MKEAGHSYADLSTFTLFRGRFTKCNSASRKYSNGGINHEGRHFRHFAEGNHHGFMQDVSFHIMRFLESLGIGKEFNSLSKPISHQKDLTSD